MNGKLYFTSMDELTFLSFSALAVPGRLHGYKELANSALERYYSKQKISLEGKYDDDGRHSPFVSPSLTTF